MEKIRSNFHIIFESKALFRMLTCTFLETTNSGNNRLKRTHKHYAQVNTHTGKKKCYFVVWASIDLLVDIIEFNESQWDNVERNLSIFYETYICPVLLSFKELGFCRSCNKLLLNSYQINENEEQE